jgi:hypothetical protein
MMVQSVRRLYSIIRDLHLYFGLFISPLVLVFAVSVVFLIHAWIPGSSAALVKRTASDLPIPSGVEFLTGRDQVAALRGVLDRLGIRGEVGVLRESQGHRLLIAVIIPGREVSVDYSLEMRSAAVTEHDWYMGTVTYLLKCRAACGEPSWNWAYMRIGDGSRRHCIRCYVPNAERRVPVERSAR